jgi:hypothetical protein
LIEVPNNTNLATLTGVTWQAEGVKRLAAHPADRTRPRQAGAASQTCGDVTRVQGLPVRHPAI